MTTSEKMWAKLVEMNKAGKIDWQVCKRTKKALTVNENLGKGGAVSC